MGVICPDCLRQGQQATRRPLGRRLRAVTQNDKPLVTYWIIGICVAVFALQWLIQPFVTQAIWYAPAYGIPGQFEPWRMVTSMFAHSPGFIFHILLNMYSLWIFGRTLELFLGRWRFLALYLVSGFAGSVMVLLSGYLSQDYLLTPVVGASGAIFGLLGAFLVIQRTGGGQTRQLLVLLGINFVITFLPGMNIAWQAHVGGLIGGLVVAAIYMYARKPQQKWLRVGLVAAWAAALIVLSCAYFVVPYTTFWS
ncbi:rhomboid family intramembrane serine protease [Klugiella xanthotipulae]|uniref:Membrane associated rhomboid family serine protease n=1 Tax=Klugiella xanthotipulae TaxID=244735 RepID=A0A543I6U1_9MICO|nr:membrane associated rhomboid family serine protease [Klugiella xanthotipulae]